jgi:hypothetical protein
MKAPRQVKKWPYLGARDVCWYCGGQLCWDNDFSYSELHGEGEGIATPLHCLSCGAEVEYSRRKEEGGQQRE